jgi:outer membrane protein assembly factor BamB
MRAMPSRPHSNWTTCAGVASCIAVLALSVVGGTRDGPTTDSGTPGLWVAGDVDTPSYVVVVTSQMVTRLDAADGRIVWRRPLVHVQSRAQVVVADSVAVVSAGGFYLHGIDATTGRLRWTRGRDDKEWDAVVGRSYELTTDGDRVYLITRRMNGVAAIEPTTGHVVWQHTDDSPGADRRFIKPYRGRLVTEFGILDAVTGTVQYRFTPGTPSRFRETADVDDDVIVNTFSDGTIDALDARSPDRGLWSSREPESRVKRVSVVGGEVLATRYPTQSVEPLTAKKGVVESFDLRSGRLVRRLAVEADPRAYFGLCSGDATRVYLTGTTCRGGRCVEAIDRSNGQRLWSRQVDPRTVGPAVPVGRSLFLWDGVDTVVALDTVTGGRRWRTKIVAQPNDPAVAW